MNIGSAAHLARPSLSSSIGRGYTWGGLGAFVMRALAEQFVSQTATNAGQDAARLVARLPVGSMPALDTLSDWSSALGGITGAGPGHMLSIVFTLLCPFGGPVWAGIIPLGASRRGVRALTQALRRGSAAPIAISASRNVLAPSTCQSGHMGTTVLIVDDNSPFGDVARQLLERGGLDVVAFATTIDQTLAYVHEFRPQIVLADIHLGAESGFDLVRRLAADDAGYRPPVVLMSTHSEAEFADLVEASAAVGFVPKVRLSAEAVLACVNDRYSA